MNQLVKEARKYEDHIIQLRRTIHANPELSYREFQTAKLVAKKLRELGIEVHMGVGGTGVVGILQGSPSGKVVGLRADMDALPVKEEVNLPFKSKNAGAMHACGHDAHVAMLLGAAMLLSDHKDELKGTIKFFFQPAEEDGGRGGAKPMIEAGAMENPKVDYVFGLHVVGEIPVRTFGIRPGAMMAAADAFKIKVHGRGGHGSRPHETIDPIFISTQLINALQGISSRIIDPREPFVLSVCSIHSGTKDNIIPDDAVIEGTIRTLNEKVRMQAKKELRKITEYICKCFGASYELELMKDAYPVTYNDEVTTKRAFEVLKTIDDTETKEIPARMGAEDFSRFLQKAPGTYYVLGTRNPKKDCVYPNHSSKFKVDEEVLKYGSVSLASLGLEFTKR